MKRGASEKYVLDEKQVGELLKETESSEDRLILELMALLGLRASEVAHLRAEWVKDGEIRKPRSQSCNCSSCQGEWKSKSEASVRSIPIPNLMADSLYTFLSQSPGGFHLTRQAIWQKVKTVAKRAKIKVRGLSEDTIYPHVLRATAASRLASAGMSAPALCYIMGWASIEMGVHYINIAQAKAEAHRQLKQILH